MKIVLLSDTHFGVKQNSITWMNSQIDFMYNEFIPYLNYLKKTEDIIVVHCGDVFDSRSSINPYIASKVREVFKKISSICTTYIIAGNHDFYSPNDDTISALDLTLSAIDNLYIIKNEIQGLINEEPNDAEVIAHSLLVPWYEFDKKELLESYIKNYKPKRIFCHTDLTRLSKEYLDMLSNTNVYSGHIHTPQKVYNLYTLGSTFPLTFADCNAKRGFYILDNETDELLFVEAKNVIKFWRFHNNEIFDIDVTKLKNDYIELYIDKLNLMNEEYTNHISYLSSKIHNITIVPNVETTKQTDTVEFSNYDIRQICKDSIPDALKQKFEEISSKC